MLGPQHLGLRMTSEGFCYCYTLDTIFISEFSLSKFVIKPMAAILETLKGCANHDYIIILGDFVAVCAHKWK